MSITIQLNGRVDSNVPVVNTWTDVGSTGHVSFTNLHDVDTTAVINAAGIYTLRLTSATADGLSTHDDMIVNTALNQTPVPNAGPAFAAVTNAPHRLAGSATDDAYPDVHSPPLFAPHTLSYSWALTANTGDAFFTPSANISNPDITFTSAAHTPYTLRLTVSDTKASGTNDATVTVTALPGTHYVSPNALPATPSSVSFTGAEYRVDMSNFAATPTFDTWWATVQADGRDIRVTDASNNPLPFDLIRFDKANKTGFMVFSKDASGSNTNVKIWVGLVNAVALNPNDTYGQYNAYRTDALGFWPDGGGDDRTRNLRHLSPVGSPAIIAGPIGLNAYTYSNTAYSKYLFPIVQASPFTLLGVSDHAASGGPNVMMGIGRSFGGSFDSASGACYVVQSGANCIAGMNTQASAIATSTAATYSATWRQYGGTFAATTSLPTAITRQATGTTGSGSSTVTNYDYFTIGRFPRLAVSTDSFVGNVSLAVLYGAVRSANYITYLEQMLDQSTFYGSWTQPL